MTTVGVLLILLRYIPLDGLEIPYVNRTVCGGPRNYARILPRDSIHPRVVFIHRDETLTTQHIPH